MKVVDFHGSRGNRALCHAVGAVLVALTKLSDAVPVNRCSGRVSNNFLVLYCYRADQLTHCPACHCTHSQQCSLPTRPQWLALGTDLRYGQHHDHNCGCTVVIPLISMAGFLTPSGPSQFVTLVMRKLYYLPVSQHSQPQQKQTPSRHTVRVLNAGGWDTS